MSGDLGVARRPVRPELFSAAGVAGKKLARRAESLLECAAMSAAMKKLVLVLLIAVLPVQALAAIVVPLCKQGIATSVVAVADHTQHDGDHHDAPAPGHEHPFTAGEVGSDHCGVGFAFAIPMMSAGLAPAATAERSWFAAAYRSGFIPEQPQRPPLV